MYAILAARQCLLSAVDLRSPQQLGKQIMLSDEMDEEVKLAMSQLLQASPRSPISQ